MSWYRRPRPIFFNKKDGPRKVLPPSGAAAGAVQWYVDPTGGNNANTGLSPSAPKQTIAAVTALYAPGAFVNLKRGERFNEQFTVSVANITIRAYGTGLNPLIDGDSVRWGVIINAANSHTIIQNVDFFECANAGVGIQSSTGKVSVIGSTITRCGSGIVIGGGGVGGQLVLADGCTITDSDPLGVGIGAGDGIQISEEASNVAHEIRNCVCTGNWRGGINCKIGVTTISNCNLHNNGENGLTCQFGVFGGPTTVNVQDTIIANNNTRNNGVGNVSIENGTIVNSKRCKYIDPTNGSNATVNINMITAGTGPDRGTTQTFNSESDEFISRTGQTNTLGTIRVNTNENGAPVNVTIKNGTFSHMAGSGIAIDGYGSSGLNLSVQNTIFDMTNTRAIRIHPDATFGAWDYNLYYRSAGSDTIVEVQDTDFYTPAQIAAGVFFTDYGVDQHSKQGDPLFYSRGNVEELVTGGTIFGNLISGQSMANIFDGNTNQAGAGGAGPVPYAPSTDFYIGKSLGSPRNISKIEVHGTNDVGYVYWSNPSITLTVRGKNGSAPANGTDGVVIGSITFTDTDNESAVRTIDCDDTNAYEHVMLTLSGGGGVSTTLAEMKIYASSVTALSSKVFQMEPLASMAPGETHACLVLSQANFSGNYTYKGRGRTKAMLRTGSPPNPWECLWIPFNFDPLPAPYHGYAFVLKPAVPSYITAEFPSGYPGGWHLERVGPNDLDEVFLASGSSPIAILGQWFTWEIEVTTTPTAVNIVVKIDGVQIVSYSDTHANRAVSGRVGFYSEDARVQVDDIEVPLAEDFENYALGPIADGALIGDNWEVVFLGFGGASVIQVADGWQTAPSGSAGYDFRLKDTSPAIDAGTNLSLLLDNTGQAWANPPNMGAHEGGSL
jgi:hypothetical protein